MADYDSDSSGAGDDIETNVLLGYASTDPTGEDFSQLGGRPTWLDHQTAPLGDQGKCKVCNGNMSLLVQLYADLPDRFPLNERRLYVLGCRKKPCRRKDGSIRALRAVRTTSAAPAKAKAATITSSSSAQQPAQNLGEMLFGAKSPTPANANPFSSGPSCTSASNPFSSLKPVEGPAPISPQASATDDLPQTFAQKARISSPSPLNEAPDALEPWSDDPTPYPSSHIDADKEYLYPVTETSHVPQNARVDSEGGNSASDEKSAFESTIDKTFQRFADRLAQSPEQILRYEFGGRPLLYSKSDAVGKLLSPTSEMKVQTAASKQNGQSSGMRMPRCASCGAARVFEMQLTPHAITVLEAEDMSVDGMDWGTIIVGVCREDCQQKGRHSGEVGYLEEWLGVQWEELVDNQRR